MKRTLALALALALASGAWAQETERVCVDHWLALRVGDDAVVNRQGWIRVWDVDTGVCVDSIDMSIPDGPRASRTYGSECDYTKVPYDYSRTVIPTNRNTRPGTPSGTAEATPLGEYQLNIIGGFTDGFHFHPVILRDGVARVHFHNNILDYGHRYRVVIDPEVFGHGISETFATKTGAAYGDTIVVDAQGRGDFLTVQGAMDAVPDFSTRETVIVIRPGDYEEIVYARNKTHLTIMGTDRETTRVHYANNEVFNPHPLTVKTNEMPGTFPSRRAAFMLDNCSDIRLCDLTIATDLKGQAEGLLVNGERIRLDRVHIIGDGDALQANGTIFMQHCQLDGGGDTILGRGALFARWCCFRNAGGPFTWVRNTSGSHGDVFVECTFESTTDYPADFGRTPNNHGKDYPDAEMVVIDCKTRRFNPLGWSALGKPTVVMLEYNTRDMDTGDPVDVSRRHSYSRQLTMPADRTTIENYRTPAYVLRGWTGE